MRRTTRQFIAYVTVAVLTFAGGLNAYSSCAEHNVAQGVAQNMAQSVAHAASGFHDHHHDHFAGHEPSIAQVDFTDDHVGAGCHFNDNCADQKPSDHDCPDGHVHCCASSVIGACADALTIFIDRPAQRFARTAAVAVRNISSPLRRPPRVTG